MTSYDADLQQLDIVCDDCDDENVFYGERVEALATALNEGWAVKRIKGEVKHLCPACKKEQNG